VTDDRENPTLRDFYATFAPIQWSEACTEFYRRHGESVSLDDERQRKQFWAAWADLRYEYADAMMTARKQPGGRDAS
jgi:hypothetical protein